MCGTHGTGSRESNLGQIESLESLQTKVFEFEEVLRRLGIQIESRSPLERTCLAVVDVLGKNHIPEMRDCHEDVRRVYVDVLGLWIFLTKILRLQHHEDFAQLSPHLRLLNQGEVLQNRPLGMSDDASNKIFELLLALVLMDVGSALVLDHPDKSRGDNPDILVTMQGRRWGFACKTVYGASGKTFFDNLDKGVDQIERSEAQIGWVVVNFRNFIDHDRLWPILNETAYKRGADPIFGAHPDPMSVAADVASQVIVKGKQVIDEVGEGQTLSTFAGKKAMPGFLAFCQTATGVLRQGAPVPASINVLVCGRFADQDYHWDLLNCMNNALHERDNWT